MWELLKTFFQIGLFTIGGGYAMIPLIEQKVVDEKHWVGHDELLDLIAVAQSCPGIFAVNISIFIGNKRLGNKGAFISALGTCLPSFLCILLIALIFQQFRENVYVEHFFHGIQRVDSNRGGFPDMDFGRKSHLRRLGSRRFGLCLR